MPPSPDTARSPIPHRDFRLGLIFFGSFAILMGIFCLLMAPLMLLGTMIPNSGQTTPSMSLIAPASAFYLVLGAANIWMGIGSILCRRWARTLLLLSSLFWLVGGLAGLLGFIFFGSEMASSMSHSEAKIPEGVLSAIRIGTYGLVGIIYIIIPGAFAWFYSRRNTRLTCESRDPKERWTDRCPPAPLAIALLNAFTALCLLAVLFFMPIFPFFGIYLEGIASVLMILLLSLVFGFCAWGLYRLRPAFWWLTLATTLLLSTSYMVTIWQGGLMEMYRRMHLPEDTLKLLENSPIVQSPYLAWFSLAYLIPYVGLMLYCRKFMMTDSPVKVAE